MTQRRATTILYKVGLVSVLVVGCGLADTGPNPSEGSEPGSSTVSPMEEQQMSPTPLALSDQCLNAANVLGFPVPCPGQLPVPVSHGRPNRRVQQRFASRQLVCHAYSVMRSCSTISITNR
jgi:hypothetical protein